MIARAPIRLKPDRTVRRVAGALAIVILTAVPALAQTRRVDSGSTSFKGFSFYWETRLAPPTPPLSDGFGGNYAVTEPNLVHRILRDGRRQVYFGYTVQIEPTTERSRFRLTFRPLSLTPELKMRFDIDATWKPLPAPQFPGSQVIRTGEVLELSLLSNEASAQHLTEYVTVQEPPRPQGFQPLDRAPGELVFAPGPPRDFTVNDAALHLREPRIFVNGRLDESSVRMLGDETGSVVWIYVANRGRFLLSVVPNATFGFRRAGEIRGSSLRFTVGADTYNVNTSGRIAPGDAAFNLYVLHQPAWRPAFPHADLTAASAGAADRVEDLLTK